MTRQILAIVAAGMLTAPASPQTTAQLPRGTILVTGPALRTLLIGSIVASKKGGFNEVYSFSPDGTAGISHRNTFSPDRGHDGPFTIYHDKVCADIFARRMVETSRCIFIAQGPLGEYYRGLIWKNRAIWEAASVKRMPKPLSPADLWATEMIRRNFGDLQAVREQRRARKMASQVPGRTRIHDLELMPLCRLDAVERCWKWSEQERR